MNLADARDIAAPRTAVWAAILDPEVLKACIPGCKELAGTVDEGFEAVVVQKVGPVKATFKGQVDVSDIVEGQSLTLTGQGKGGPAGFAKGAAKVSFADTAEGGTLLTYDVEAKVGGKLAQLGSRIIDGFTKKLADQFFERFQDGLEDPTDADDVEEDEEKPKKGWIGRMLG
ncbi:CoxG family protein [Roseobacter sp. CCS2]|uniref:CoxG family protein n=1 Tax=Roseobacter sp. CCS2 TaxID=391593 RepID=UPI0000F3E48A|nr:carbon monoxide dehydrogenase subunit G [Roseobacter sp. CCS2]EBA12624.1 carbon monoxide dehydrogenase operon G protein [Roseobacter sp. CCS2]